MRKYLAIGVMLLLGDFAFASAKVTEYDGSRLCNPSAIATGTNACFAIEFDEVHPPASEIKWAVVEGEAEFSNTNLGERVYVQSSQKDQMVKLRVQIGDCKSRPPEITAFVVDPLSVKLTVWIVRDDFGYNAPRTPTEVTNMVNEVNKIYEQIGVNFYIDSISFTNRSDWLDVSIRRNGKEVCNPVRRRELVNLLKNTGGFELYFIDKIAERVNANTTNSGIVLSTNATVYTVAHEIGHSFGCADIYSVKTFGGFTPLVSNHVDMSRAEDDWSNGTGCRYYSKDITQTQLIKRLIMYGYGYRGRADLSFGSVYGYTKYGEEGLVDVGFFRGASRRVPIYHR